MTAQRPVQTVPPAESPVELLEAKEHLRVDHDDEDTLIQTLIDAATAHLDGWTGILGRCLVTQTWRLDLDGFPGCIRLPFGDVQSVTVAYTDANGATQTLSASAYHLVTDALGAKLVLADGQTWPNTDPLPNAVRVTMVCGFGDPEDVPWALKAALLLHVAALYEKRENIGPPIQSTGAYEALTAPYRRVGT